MNSTWYVDKSSGTPTRPKSTTVTRTVGLLNLYEYYATFSYSDGLATYKTAYLMNGGDWLSITPSSDVYLRYVDYTGNWSDTYSSYGKGIRPSVNLKSNIRYISGDGTIFSPYKLEGDEQETINGKTLLSTRYSGEYITFNNELYRIIGTEDNLTKITAVDRPTQLKSNIFDSNTANFTESSIKIDLENYYQELDEKVKNLIEHNTVWYLGEVGDGISYKASTCKTVDIDINIKTCEKTGNITITNIGMPRVGEMFTSQITRGITCTFFTLTPYSASQIRYVLANDLSYRTPSAYKYGTRPSMYLKSTVKIASTNTGDGTYEHPYSIELGS